MNKIWIALSLLCFAATAQAQVILTQNTLTYFQDFNTLDTSSSNSHTLLPDGWSISEHGTSANYKYRGGNGSLTTNDIYSFGAYNSTERAIGSIGGGTVDTMYYGMQFQNNVGADISLANITYKQEQWRSGDTGVSYTDTVIFYYAFVADSVSDAAANWIEVPALMMKTLIVSDFKASPVNGDSAAVVISADLDITVPANSKLWIRWMDWNSRGSDDALAVDSLTVTFGTLRPIVVNKTPANNTTHLDIPVTVRLTFDQPVLKGSGSIYIKNETDQYQQILSATSAGVVVNGNEVTLEGVNLLSTRTYHITFDSSAFYSESLYPSFGISDTAEWRFSTIEPTGIHEIGTLQLPLAVIGVATGNNVQLLFSMPTAGEVHIIMTDISGRTVYQASVQGSGGENRLQLLPASLRSGMYLIRLSVGSRSGFVKCMIP